MSYEQKGVQQCSIVILTIIFTTATAATAGFGRGPFRGWRSRGGGFGGREGRMFDGGELKLVILALIAEKPRYGYEIIKELGERVGGDYSPSPGVVYPTLTMLEEMGYAQREPGPAGAQALYG